LATCFDTIKPSSGQIRNTVLVYSASAYTVGSHPVYKCIDIIDHFVSVRRCIQKYKQ